MAELHEVLMNVEYHVFCCVRVVEGEIGVEMVDASIVRNNIVRSWLSMVILACYVMEMNQEVVCGFIYL